VAGAIETFGLAPVCGRRVDRLSMGQRQRLRLALAFIHDPRLVLLDEPTTSLDEDGLTVLGKALDELTARDGSALVCLPSGWPEPPGIEARYVLAGGRIERR
jgi:ABC-type multidrug transport system ATPase subunit